MLRKNRLLVSPNRTGIILMVLMVLVVLVACGGQTGSQQSKEGTVTVQEIVNQVEVNDLQLGSDDSGFVDLQLGQFLQTGNLIKTHENSSARIDISIQQFTRVSRTTPNTVWRLGRFALNGETVIELQEGKIFVFDAGDGQEHWPLHIETPAGTASARGTWMAVEYLPESGEVQVECLRGICELENDLGYQVFTNEETVTTTAVTVPPEPEPMEPEQVEEFLQLPEVLTEELTIPVPYTPIEVKAKLQDAREAAVVRKVLTDDYVFIPPPAPDSEDGPGINIPLSASKPADNGSIDSPTFEDPAAAEDPGPQSLDTGPGEPEYLITDGLEASGISGLGEGTKPEEGKDFYKAKEHFAKSQTKAAEQLAKSQTKATDELAKAQTKIAQELADARAKIAQKLIDAASKGAGEFFAVEANLAEELAKVETKAIEDLAKAQAKASKDLDKAQAKAVEEFAKSEAKYAEELAKDQTETGQQLILARPNGPDEAAKAAEQLAKDESKAIEELAKAEAKASKELAKAEAKATEELAKAKTKATEELTKAYEKALVELHKSAEEHAKAKAKSAEEQFKAEAKAAEELEKAESNTGVDNGETDTGVDDGETDPAVGDGETDTAVDDGDPDPVPPNNPPVAVADAAAGMRDVNKISISVLSNDSDADGDSLTVANLTQPADGSVVLRGDYVVDYFPDSGFTGVVTFTYTANDGKAYSNTVTVTVTVSAPTNTLPVAVADAAPAVKDVNKINIIVLSNDSDADGDTLTVTNLTQPSNGSVVLKGDFTVDYFPDSGFTGVDTFTYTANDGTGDSNTVTVTVTVSTAPNNLPVAVDDTASGEKNVNKINIIVLSNDSDADSDVMSVTNLTSPSNGSVVLKGDQTVDYFPDAGFAGVDTFTYTANDGTGDSGAATVTITVNAAPVAVADAATTAVNAAVTVTVLGNDTDANSDTLTVTNLTQPTNGSASVNGNNTVTYTPDSAFAGADTFTYTANDGRVDSNVATVTITVNAAPVAVNDADTTSVDVAVTVNVLGNDTDANSDTLTVTNLIQPSNGSASVNGDNTVTYTPNTGWTGTDTFTYKANDGTVDSANPATVTITVSASSVETVTLNVTEGWNSKDSKNLSTQLLLTNIQTSNDVWFDKDMSGGAPAYFISLEFDQTVPSGATITSVKVYIEHWENNGFLDGELAWEVGGGTLSSPSSLQSTTPTILLGSGNEAVVEWDVTSSIDTAAEANDLKVKITNNSTVGKKNSVDHVYVVVEYTE